jgi:hypothetical protein
MRNNLFLIIVSTLAMACGQSTGSATNENPRVPEPTKTVETAENGDKAPACLNELLSLPDAEKILGEPAHIADPTSTTGADVTVYKCAYKANKEDTKSNKTGVVYFVAEDYGQLDAAKKKYAFIKTANQDHGIKVLNDLGDEAYYHSDNENFYFIMVRKGTRVFNMKVNKITSLTSLDEFNRVARHITSIL